MHFHFTPRPCTTCMKRFTPTNSLDKHCCLLCKLVDYCDRSGGDDACWEWTEGRCEFGYGSIGDGKGSQINAHRAMYQELHNIELPPETVVRHKCDNPPCINPTHLEIGTHQENVNDKMERNRHVTLKGEMHGNAKVTNEMALAIYSSNDKAEDIAKQFSIGLDIVWKIRAGSSWTHVTGGVPRDRAKSVLAKLTDEDVIAIFKAEEKGITLATRYGISAGLVSVIRSGKRYGHLTNNL